MPRSSKNPRWDRRARPAERWPRSGDGSRIPWRLAGRHEHGQSDQRVPSVVIRRELEGLSPSSLNTSTAGHRLAQHNAALTRGPDRGRAHSSHDPVAESNRWPAAVQACVGGLRSIAEKLHHSPQSGCSREPIPAACRLVSSGRATRRAKSVLHDGHEWTTAPGAPRMHKSAHWPRRPRLLHENGRTDAEKAHRAVGHVQELLGGRPVLHRSVEDDDRLRAVAPIITARNAAPSRSSSHLRSSSPAFLRCLYATIGLARSTWLRTG